MGEDTSLAALHEILQLAFAWRGDHLHRFIVHGVEYGIGYEGGPGFRDDARQPGPRRALARGAGTREQVGYRLHYPDLLVRRAEDGGDDAPWGAVELDMAAKRTRRLRAILAAYLEASHLGPLLYFVERPAMRQRLADLVAEMGLQEKVIAYAWEPFDWSSWRPRAGVQRPGSLGLFDATPPAGEDAVKPEPEGAEALDQQPPAPQSAGQPARGQDRPAMASAQASDPSPRPEQSLLSPQASAELLTRARARGITPTALVREALTLDVRRPAGRRADHARRCARGTTQTEILREALAAHAVSHPRP